MKSAKILGDSGDVCTRQASAPAHDAVLRKCEYCFSPSVRPLKASKQSSAQIGVKAGVMYSSSSAEGIVCRSSKVAEPHNTAMTQSAQ